MLSDKASPNSVTSRPHYSNWNEEQSVSRSSLCYDFWEIQDTAPTLFYQVLTLSNIDFFIPMHKFSSSSFSSSCPRHKILTFFHYSLPTLSFLDLYFSFQSLILLITLITPFLFSLTPSISLSSRLSVCLSFLFFE